MAALFPTPVAVVAVALVLAGVTDVRAFRVSNRLTLPLLLAGVLYHTVLAGMPGLGGSAVGVLVGFILTAPFLALGGMGAGDVKLLAAVGAWLGAPVTFCLFLASCLAAGAYALALLLFCGNAGETLGRLAALIRRLVTFGRRGAAEFVLESEVRRPDRRRRMVPFAAAMAVSFATLLLWALLHKAP